MWTLVVYVAFLAYAAGLFIYSVTHDRPWAAIGILLSVSGFQFAALDTLNASVSIAIALVGLAFVGRDVISSMLPHIVPALTRDRGR
jgi:hypothetical protein